MTNFLEMVDIQSNLTLKTVKIRTSLALRTKSPMTDLAKSSLRTVKIRTT